MGKTKETCKVVNGKVVHISSCLAHPDHIEINGIKMKYNKEFGSYYGTTSPEPYDVGKHHFKPTFRSIYISSEMYKGTAKSFFYITSHIHGSMRLYRHHNWYDAEVANIFAHGKTLEEAVMRFTNNLTHLMYNKGGE